MTSPTRAWKRDFDDHAGQHAGVKVSTVSPLTGPACSALGRSLATFQLGESGTGAHLLAAARASDAEPEYVDALDAFITEEQEHARLLAIVLGALDHPLRTDHWTDRIFVMVRRLKSLRTEVLTLLVAEVIALRYYSALRDGIESPELAEVFGRIHADEIRHVEFHAATLPVRLGAWPRPVRGLVRLMWNTLVVGSSVVVAVDHRAALRLVGVKPAAFVREVLQLRAGLDEQLFGGR